MPTIVVDTNVVLRYLLDDHPEWSQRAKLFWAGVRQGQQRVFLPEGVLVECVYVLFKVYRVPRIELADRLLSFLEIPNLTANSLPVLRTTLQLFRDHNVDLVDAVVLATARVNHWDFESFDRDLHRMASTG
ncbi:MAG: PIN domain-containing protein [Magnetococcales bacterium]|nr:PIN domain-containing protein [Magnetococcales bacterium]